MFTRHALNCACLKNAWFYCARHRKWLSIVIYTEFGVLTTWQSAFFLGARESELPQRLFASICGRHQAKHAFQGTWSSPHPTPPTTSCVASTMSASSRNVIITPPHPTPNFLRSINHVGKFKERDHHPTPPMSTPGEPPVPRVSHLDISWYVQISIYIWVAKWYKPSWKLENH